MHCLSMQPIGIQQRLGLLSNANNGLLTVQLYNGCALFALQSLFKAVNWNTLELILSQALLTAYKH